MSVNGNGHRLTATLQRRPQDLTSKEWRDAISSAKAENVESAANSMDSIPNSPSLSPILISFLSSGSRRLREASSVALAHIGLSGGGEVLQKQCVLEQLLRQIRKDVDEEEKGAYFYAIYHLLGVIPPSQPLLLELTTYSYALSSYGSVIDELTPIIPSVFEVLLYEIFQKSDPRPLVKIVTPLVRLLGNLCASGDTPSLSVLQEPDLPAVLTTLLSTNYLHLNSSHLLQKILAERTSNNSRQSVKEAEYMCHVFVREDGLTAVCLSDYEYPTRVAHTLLTKILEDFSAQVPRSEWSGRKEVSGFNGPLDVHLKKFQVPEQADSMSRLQNELDETKIILHGTIESVLDRGEKLDDLIQKSEGLSMHSKAFYKSARKTNSCCSSWG
ncbi:YKT6 [Lepeophtheirus salmonis]|uniref:YKT6 n=1 Tax=Lepeophtheirus salmonis TaxID=72036 RepID=A0A7R8CP02_LEPSM|nr:YKT6 [Lepeophtheirus salmonis]CAF2881644.1 YKT6 [Lepeophtheirus salmonis]